MSDDIVSREMKRLAGGKVREKHALKKIDGYAGELKRSAWRKFKDTFFEEDLPSVKKDIIKDIAIPAIKDLIADIFIGGIERTLFGTGVRSSRRLRTGYSQLARRIAQPSYASYYDNRRQPARESEVPFDEDETTFKNIVLRDRAAATDLLETLREAIRDYGNVSVAELYEAVDKESLNFTDNYLGWTNLDNVQIRRVSTGYWLDLPKPVQLQ